MDGINNYSCNCKAGYTGDHCEAGKFVVDVLSKYKLVNCDNDATSCQYNYVHDSIGGHCKVAIVG